MTLLKDQFTLQIFSHQNKTEQKYGIWHRVVVYLIDDEGIPGCICTVCLYIFEMRYFSIYSYMDWNKKLGLRVFKGCICVASKKKIQRRNYYR